MFRLVGTETVSQEECGSTASFRGKEGILGTPIGALLCQGALAAATSSSVSLGLLQFAQTLGHVPEEGSVVGLMGAWHREGLGGAGSSRGEQWQCGETSPCSKTALHTCKTAAYM